MSDGFPITPSAAVTARDVAGVRRPDENGDFYQWVEVTDSALPDGAATEVTLAAVLAAVTADPPPVAGSVEVTNLPAIQAISAAALPLPAGAATEVTLLDLHAAAEETAVGVGVPTDAEASAGNGTLVALLKRLRTLLSTPLAVTGTFWQAVQPTKEVTAATSTQASVGASVTSVTLLAANANRLGATIWNDSTSVLYLKLGATASATTATIKMAADSYYEVPRDWVGVIDGIWVAATGNARVGERTA